jgi:hypothetical protein
MLSGPAYRKVRRCFAAGLAAGVLALSGGWASASSDGQATGIEAAAATVASFDSARSASILASQVNTGNTVIETNGVHRTSLESSVLGGAGIFVINQDTGNFANQANIVVISLGATSGSAIDEMSTALFSRITGNTAIITGGARSNRIVGSFGNTFGVFAINQNSGNFNNQLNAFSLTFGVAGDANLIALSDTTLAAVAGANGGQEQGAGPRSDYISDSFDGFRGVGMVTQTSGDGNVVGSSISLSLQVTTLR